MTGGVLMTGGRAREGCVGQEIPASAEQDHDRRRELPGERCAAASCCSQTPAARSIDTCYVCGLAGWRICACALLIKLALAVNLAMPCSLCASGRVLQDGLRPAGGPPRLERRSDHGDPAQHPRRYWCCAAIALLMSMSHEHLPRRHLQLYGSQVCCVAKWSATLMQPSAATAVVLTAL